MRRLIVKETIFGFDGRIMIALPSASYDRFNIGAYCPIVSMVPSVPAHPLVKASGHGRPLAYPV
jgi:hypothetical protein